MQEIETASQDAMKRILLCSFTSLLILGKIAEITFLYDVGLGYSEILLTLVYLALLSGTITGMIAKAPVDSWKVLLLWVSASIFFHLAIGGDIVGKLRAFNVWQFQVLAPLLLAIPGAMATSVTAKALREKNYKHLLMLPLVALIVWGGLLLIETLA